MLQNFHEIEYARVSGMIIQSSYDSFKYLNRHPGSSALTFQLNSFHFSFNGRRGHDSWWITVLLNFSQATLTLS